MKKSSPPKKGAQKAQKALEVDYLKLFTPLPLPYQGVYTDEDSLEQPSALKYVPSTTTPNVGA